MKKPRKLLGIYLTAAFIFTVAAVVLRTVACFTELDFSSGYFDDKLCITIADVLVMAGSVLSLSYIFAEDKELSLEVSFSGSATYIPGGLVAVGMIFMAARMIFAVASGRGGFISALTLSSTLSLIMLLLALLSVCAAANFLLNSLIEKPEDTKRAAFGVLTVIFLTFYAIYLYFNPSAPHNTPAKVTDQMAYLFTAVFFLYETRISLGRNVLRPYVGFGMIAAMLTAYSCLPSLIIYFARGELISDSIAESALTLTLMLFIASRLILCLVLRENKENPTVSAIAYMANLRATAIAEEIDPHLLSRTLAESNNEETEGDERDDEDINYSINLNSDAQNDEADEEGTEQ